MKNGTCFSTAGAALVLCVLMAGGPAEAQVIGAGHDLLETDSGATLDDVQLPAGFFGPGSLPFDGRVYLQGVPFASFDPDGPGPTPTFTDLLPTDTVVRRMASAGPVYPSTVPIEIVQLSLVSVEPLKVTFGAGTQSWQLEIGISVNPGTGLVDPPQVAGTMTINHEYAGGGTFDSTLPVTPYLTFRRLDGPGLIGPMISPLPLVFEVRGESWSHVANPLIFPKDGQSAIVAPGLTTNFFPGVVCDACPAPERTAVCYSVDGGAFNPGRTGAPLSPVANPAEGLFQPHPPHLPPNDVYAVGTAPGGNAYASEGEVFQSAGAPLGAPPNVSNVDRMSSALGLGPAPGGPPYMGPFAPNPGAPPPAPPFPGGLGTFGLGPDDNVDGLSFGRDSGHVLFFSVDPWSLGLAGTAVRFHALTSPFAGAAAPPFPTTGGGDPGNEAAGDVYKSLPFAPFGSYIPLHLATGRYATLPLAANQLFIDEFDLGLQAPAVNGSAIAPPEDDLDALELSDAADPIFGVDLIDNPTGLAPPDGIPDRFTFFSIDTASPANGLPGIDPDDILVTPPAGFVYGVFADGATTIGLLAGDDIDGLALSDVPPLGVLTPGLDEALFSLHPGSPSVVFGPDGIPGNGDEVSPADVLHTKFAGSYVLYAAAGALGLLPTDNVNALDIWPRDFPQPGDVRGGGGGKKKLSVEDEARAKHGIRISQKRRCNLTTTGNFQVTVFGFGSFPVNLGGPPNNSSGMRGATEFNPATGQTQIPIELLSMSLQGNHPMLGSVFVTGGRELGFKPSLGAIHPDSAQADLPGQSFFDVFVRIDLPDLGMQLHNEEPFRVQTTVVDFPPYGHTFQGNVPTVLLDQFNNPRGTLDFAAHRPRCVSNTECDDLNPGTTDTCSPVTGACSHVPEPDSDGDGVVDTLDNCKGVANGGQGTLAFPIYPEMIRFAGPNQICWTTPAQVREVVGPLSGVSSYTVSMLIPHPLTTCIPAPEPAFPPGDGVYYLIEHDCPAGTWQSTLGSEPKRDDVLP